MYVSRQEIEAVIPGPHLVGSLDDNGDGYLDEEVLTAVLQAASDAVDAYLSSLYPVPFATPPAAVRQPAFIFACEAVYDRRAVSEKNPYRERADAWRARLEKIGNGQLPLEASTRQAFDPGALITKPMATDGTSL